MPTVVIFAYKNLHEIMLWNSHEWEEDPECVIGAIFNMARTPVPMLLEQLQRTQVVDGCWVP